MSNETPHGEDVSLPIELQLAAPARLHSNSTRVALAPAVALSAMAPESGEPGSASVTVGAVESTRRVTAPLA